MKYLKMIGLAAVAAMALMAFAAGSASATTLEHEGAVKNAPLTIPAELATGTIATLETTSGSGQSKCKKSTVSGTTASPYTGTTVTGPISTLSFSEPAEGKPCTVTTHKAGTLHVEHIKNTTNGTVSSSGAEVTVFSEEFGVYLNCKTGAGVDIGTLTGVKTGHATMDINAVLNCGFFVPSAKWTGTYTVKTAIGVVA